MLRIKESEDFGLGFNCMTRLYMDRYDEDIFMDMIKVCEEYLKWFSHRTIICSLRDLIREYPCFLQVLFGKSCKIFLENVASPNWRKLQSLDWQLSCQPHSHCRPNLVVTA